MNRALFAICCFAAAAVAGPLGAQPPRPAVAPAAPESRTSPGATIEGERPPMIPPVRTIDDPASRPAGRISETAPPPAPGPGSGAERFRADLASCATLEPESRASCRREMHAARAQGLYPN